MLEGTTQLEISDQATHWTVASSQSFEMRGVSEHIMIAPTREALYYRIIRHSNTQNLWTYIDPQASLVQLAFSYYPPSSPFQDVSYIL